MFQFANFFKSTGPGGINPDFSFTLKPKVLAPLSVFPPAKAGIVEPAPCGNLGLISITDWIDLVETSIFKHLKSSLKPTTIPFFLFYNVLMCDAAGCGIVRFHDSFRNPNYNNALQTYAVAEYDTTTLVASSADVSNISHEINELQDDPIGTNATPPWGHVGQVSGCQASLEVGDPLSMTTFPIPMSNGSTYHVQDLAFLSWLYRQSPSIGLDGLYSLHGSFTTSAGAICR